MFRKIHVPSFVIRFVSALFGYFDSTDVSVSVYQFDGNLFALLLESLRKKTINICLGVISSVHKI